MGGSVRKDWYGLESNMEVAVMTGILYCGFYMALGIVVIKQTYISADTKLFTIISIWRILRVFVWRCVGVQNVCLVLVLVLLM